MILLGGERKENLNCLGSESENNRIEKKKKVLQLKVFEKVNACCEKLILLFKTAVFFILKRYKLKGGFV